MKPKIFTLRGMFLFFLLTSIQAFPNIYYLPHIHTSSDAWETYLIIDRVVNGNADYTLTLYDEDGNVVNTLSGTIPANIEYRLSLRELGGVTGTFVTKNYPIRVRLGYIAKEDLGGGTAEFALPYSLSTQVLMTLSNYYHQLTWSGFALFNGSNEDISVTAYGYKGGTQVVSKTFNMAPHTKVVDYFDNFLGLSDFTDIDSVLFTTESNALTGIVISGKENDKLLFAKGMGVKENQTLTHLIQNPMSGSYLDILKINGKFYQLFESAYDYYLKEVYPGATDTEYRLTEGLLLSKSYHRYALRRRAVVSSNGENIIFPYNDNEHKVHVREVNLNGETLWDTEVGQFPSSSYGHSETDFFIAIETTNGSAVVAFRDDSQDKGIVKVLSESDGSVIKTFELSSSGIFYNAFKYNNYVGIGWTYESNSHYYLQFMFINPNGDIVKQIYGETPVYNDRWCVFYNAIQFGNYIAAAIGIPYNENVDTIEETYYKPFTLIIPFSDSDFSNAENTSHSVPMKLAATDRVFLSMVDPIAHGSNSYDYALVGICSSIDSFEISHRFYIEGKLDSYSPSYYFFHDLPFWIGGFASLEGNTALIGAMFYNEKTELQLLEKAFDNHYAYVGLY